MKRKVLSAMALIGLPAAAQAAPEIPATHWEMHNGSTSVRALNDSDMWLKVSCGESGPTPYELRVTIEDRLGRFTRAQHSAFTALIEGANSSGTNSAMLLTDPPGGQKGTHVLRKGGNTATPLLVTRLSKEAVNQIRAARKLEVKIPARGSSRERPSTLNFGTANAGSAIDALKCTSASAAAALNTKSSMNKAPAWDVGDIIDHDAMPTTARQSAAGWMPMGGELIDEAHVVSAFATTRSPERLYVYYQEIVRRASQGGMSAGQVQARLEFVQRPGEVLSYECPNPSGNTIFSMVDEKRRIARSVIYSKGPKPTLSLREWSFKPGQCEIYSE